MKTIECIKIIFILSNILLFSCQAKNNENKNNKNEVSNIEIETVVNQDDLSELIHSHQDISILDNAYFLEYKKVHNIIDDEQLSIINFILKNVIESFSHKMRGEVENQVFTDLTTGAEIVLDKDGNWVEGFNAANFNMHNIEEEPIEHFRIDRISWLNFGNSPEDPTFPRERFLAYMQELNYAIQAFVFLPKNEKTKLSKIQWNNLTEREREVYSYFSYLIFNDSHKIKLVPSNYQELVANSDFYYSYFDQVMFIGFNDR